MTDDSREQIIKEIRVTKPFYNFARFSTAQLLAMLTRINERNEK